MIKKIILLASFLYLPSQAIYAHGGGLNHMGCHNEYRTGGYHCHRSQGWNSSSSSLANPLDEYHRKKQEILEKSAKRRKIPISLFGVDLSQSLDEIKPILANRFGCQWIFRTACKGCKGKILSCSDGSKEFVAVDNISRKDFSNLKFNLNFYCRTYKGCNKNPEEVWRALHDHFISRKEIKDYTSLKIRIDSIYRRDQNDSYTCNDGALGDRICLNEYFLNLERHNFNLEIENKEKNEKISFE